MLTSVVQRWDHRRPRYRPAGETVETGQYEVVETRSDREAKAFILQHHYLGSYPAARRKFLLYRRADLVGVAVFSVPVNYRALAGLPGEPEACVELGRFVLGQSEPANTETFFLGRAFDLLRAQGFTGVMSMSDPVARTDASGSTTFPGHIGTIYQAHNAVYAGRATARTLRLLPDGATFNARSAQKIRAGERGWRGAAAVLVAHGADPLHDSDHGRAWLAEWVPRLTRPLPHAGNFRYLWALQKRDRKHLPAAMPYPKFALSV